MGLGIEELQGHILPCEDAAVVPLLVLDKGSATRVNGEGDGLDPSVPDRVDDVFVLGAKGVAEDAQSVLMSRELRITKREVIRVTDHLQLVRAVVFADEYRHVVQGIDGEAAQQGAFR